MLVLRFQDHDAAFDHAAEAEAEERAEEPRRAPGKRTRIERILAQALGSPGMGLPGDVRASVERALGTSLGGVTVHAGGASAAAAEALDAQAFAVGQQIHFRGELPSFETDEGVRVLAHELAHTVQQRGAPADGPIGVSAPGDAHELEAERFAQSYLRGRAEQVAPVGVGTVSRLIVQRDDPPATLAPGQDCEAGGDQTAPVLLLRRTWLARYVARGTVARLTLASCPEVVSRAAQELTQVYPNVPAERIASLLSIDLTRGHWADPVIRIEPRGQFQELVFLDRSRALEVFPSAAGVVIWADAAQFYPEAPDLVQDGRVRLATAIIERLERDVDASMLDTPRSELRDRLLGGSTLPTDRSGVARVQVSAADLAYLFGDTPARFYFARVRHGAGDDGAVVETGAGGRMLPAGVSDEEREQLAPILRAILGQPPSPPPETPADPQALLPGEVEALRRLAAAPEAERERILTTLRRMSGGRGPQRDLNLVTAIDAARAEVEREDAAARVGTTLADAHGPIALDAPTTPLVGRAIDGEITQPFQVNVGTPAQFSFVIANETPVEATAMMRIEWFALRLDERGEPIRPPAATHAPPMFAAGSEPVVFDPTFTPTFTEPGRYEIHAFVNHSHYLPRHFQVPCEVLATHQRLDQLEQLGAGRWGADDDATYRHDVRFDVLATIDDATGSSVEGELTRAMARSGWLTGDTESGRLEGLAQHLEEALRVYPDGSVHDALLARLGRVRAMQARVDRLREDRTQTNVEVQAFFASRSAQVTQSGELHIICRFRVEGAGPGRRYLGELWDQSELLGTTVPHLEAEGATYDEMMERLFLALTEEYPSGEVSFAFQLYDDRGHATSRYRRLRRETDTYRQDLRETVYDPRVQVVVNVVTTLLTIFPPTAGVGVTIGFLYNAGQTLDQLATSIENDTFEWTREGVDVSLMLLDLVGSIGGEVVRGVRCGERTMTVVRVSERVLSVSEHLGDAWMFMDGYESQLRDLRDGLVTELAETQAQIQEIEGNQADPRLPALLAQRDRLARQVRTQATELFAEMAAREGLMRISSHVARHMHADRARAAAEELPGLEPDLETRRRGETEGAELDPERFARARAEAEQAGQRMTAEHEERMRTELGVPLVERDATLGRGVRFDVINLPNGERHVIGVRYGSDATVGDVLHHRSVIQLVERYNGFVGGLRRVWDQMIAAVGGRATARHDNPFPPGTVAHDSWFELHKLDEIIDARRAALGTALGPDETAQLRADIEFLEDELERHRDNVREIVLDESDSSVAAGLRRIPASEAPDGVPRPSDDGFDDSHYWYEPLGSGRYQIHRYRTARDAPFLRLVYGEDGEPELRERGATPEEAARRLVETMGRGPRQAFQRLARRFGEDRTVPLRDVAVTGRTIGDLDRNGAFARGLQRVLETALREGPLEMSAAEARSEAAEIVARVTSHEIVVVLGTDQLRRFAYRSAYSGREAIDAEGDLHHIIPLMLGGDHTLLVDVDPVLHRQLHDLIDGLRLDEDTTLAPASLRNSRGLSFAEGAAVLNDDGTLQVYQFRGGRMVPVGGGASGGGRGRR